MNITKTQLIMVALAFLFSSGCANILSMEEMQRRCNVVYGGEGVEVTVRKVNNSTPYKCIVRREGEWFGSFHWIPTEEQVEQNGTRN